MDTTIGAATPAGTERLVYSVAEAGPTRHLASLATSW